MWKAGKEGDIIFKNRRFRISKPFRGELLALRPTALDGAFTLHLCWHQIGTVDLGVRAEGGLCICGRRKSGAHKLLRPKIGNRRGNFAPQAAALPLMSRIAMAQSYPSRAVRIRDLIIEVQADVQKTPCFQLGLQVFGSGVPISSGTHDSPIPRAWGSEDAVLPMAPAVQASGGQAARKPSYPAFDVWHVADLLRF
jgi:hypothetical protein